MDYIIQKNDTPSKLAKFYTGKENRWPEFCKANPQFPKHPQYGCTFYVGKKATLPDSWVQTVADPTTGQPVVIPIAQAAPTATAAATGPAVTTAVGPATEQQVAASSSSGKIILIGAAGVAILVVAVYAMKRKAQAA